MRHVTYQLFLFLYFYMKMEGEGEFSCDALDVLSHLHSLCCNFLLKI